MKETWGSGASGGVRVRDFSLYTGALGTAYLLFKAYLVSQDWNDLKLCSQIVQGCDYASRGSG